METRERRERDGFTLVEEKERKVDIQRDGKRW